MLLQQWEGQSAKLKSLEVDIYRIDKNLWGWRDYEEHFVGHAAFQLPQRASISTTWKVKLQVQVDPNDKSKKKQVPAKISNQIESTPYQSIVCTESEVWDRHFDAKQIFIYPLGKDAWNRVIEEGPLPFWIEERLLPFLFDIKANEIKQRYEMVLESEDQNGYLVKLKPRLPEDLRGCSIAWISLDRTLLLPTRIVLIVRGGKGSQEFVLSHHKPNTPVNPSFFETVNPGKPWRVERRPGAQAPPRGMGRE